MGAGRTAGNSDAGHQPSGQYGQTWHSIQVNMVDQDCFVGVQLVLRSIQTFSPHYILLNTPHETDLIQNGHTIFMKFQ